MKQTIKLSLTLAAYTVVACVGLAFVYRATQPLIQAAADREVTAALSLLVGEASSFEPVTETLSTGVPSIVIDRAYVAKKGNEVIGLVAQVTGPTYASATILFSVNMARQLGTIQFMAISDTPGLGTKVTDEAFAGQFTGKSLDDQFKLGSDLSAVSGATISSRGVSTMLQVASWAAGDYLAGKHGGASGSGSAPVVKEAAPVDVETALQELFPGATFTDVSADITNTLERSVVIDGAWLATADGTVLGIAVQTSGQTYKATTMMTGVKTDRTLAGIRINTSSDTPRIGLAAMVSESFYELFAGKSVDDGFLVNASGFGHEGEMDAVSGATISMMGVANMVKISALEGSAYLAARHGGSGSSSVPDSIVMNQIPEME